MRTLICTLALLIVVMVPSFAQNGYRGNGPGSSLAVPVAPATAEEIQWLTFMREEEKLARDVYLALADKLMAKGTKSIQDAIEVGVLIEKTGIADLETALKTTAKFDIKRVFTNLLDGSYNHLEALEANLEVICTVAGQ